MTLLPTLAVRFAAQAAVGTAVLAARLFERALDETSRRFDR